MQSQKLDDRLLDLDRHRAGTRAGTDSRARMPRVAVAPMRPRRVSHAQTSRVPRRLHSPSMRRDGIDVRRDQHVVERLIVDEAIAAHVARAR